MTVPSEARQSAAAYYSWLQHEADATDLPRVRDSLKWWLSSCKTGHVQTNSNDLHVVVCDAGVDLGRRLIPIPQTDFPASKTAVGWTLTDHPMIGADISGAVVFGNGIVILENQLYADCFRSSPAAWIEIGWFAFPETIGFERFDITDNSCILRRYHTWKIREYGREDEYFLFNSNYGAGNFGHFLHDTLAQLTAYDHMSILRGRRLTPILSARLKYPMQQYLFERLIDPIENAVYLEDGPLRPAVCFTSTNAMHQIEKGRLSVAAMRYLRHRLGGLHRAEIKHSKEGKKLFVSRADARNNFDRRFANDELVEALFVKFGFEPVLVSSLDPSDTIEMFADCSFVAGVHGAGLLNGLFSRKQVRLLELIDYPGSWTSIHMVYSACGLKADRIPALESTVKSNGLPYFDLEKIEQLLKTLD